MSELLWELTRSTGLVSLLLLTIAVLLGTTSAWGSPAERAVRQGVHRWAAGLAVALLVVHVTTSVVDAYVPLTVRDAFVPFAAGYRPFWVGLGTVASDLLLAVLLTSLARGRLRGPGWRRVHVLAYAAWPLALLHAFGAGTDVQTAAVRAVAAGCGTAVVCVLGVRLARGWAT